MVSCKLATTILFAQVLSASADRGLKKSKAAGSTSEVQSCPNYTGGASGSKKGSKAGSSCDDGYIDHLECGDIITNQKVRLQRDLYCDFEETITLKGPNASLDCNDFSIHGVQWVVYEGNPPTYATVVLEDGASLYNCNVVQGIEGVRTRGNGCFTIEKVKVTNTFGDAVHIGNSGTTILTDINVQGTMFGEGIEVQINAGEDDDLFISVENASIEDTFNNAFKICSNNCGTCGGGRDITAEFHGVISMERNQFDGLLLDDDDGNDDIDLTVFGHLSIIGSGDDGIDIQNSRFSIELADGSTTEVCYSGRIPDVINEQGGFDFLLNGPLFVRDGASLVCDTGDNNDCTASCPLAGDRAKVCIE